MVSPAGITEGEWGGGTYGLCRGRGLSLLYHMYWDWVVLWCVVVYLGCGGDQQCWVAFPSLFLFLFPPFSIFRSCLTFLPFTYFLSFPFWSFFVLFDCPNSTNNVKIIHLLQYMHFHVIFFIGAYIRC